MFTSFADICILVIFHWNISLSTLHVFVMKFQKSLNKNNGRQDKIIQVYVYVNSVFQVLRQGSLNYGYFCPACGLSIWPGADRLCYSPESVPGGR